jgi:signal transduction histidine kinase
MATFPEWWNWDRSFTGHAEMRMEQRGVPRSIPGLPLCAVQMADVKRCLFRISQEVLHNVVKHSGATAAIVRLVATRCGMRLHIADNGKGFVRRQTWALVSA